MPDPAIGQREAIRNAIDAAETAVAAVNNKAGPDVVTTADQRIADARAAIDAAQNVPSPERNAFTGNVNVLDSRLSSAKAARTAAMTAAQQAADKAAMEKASKLYPAIQAYNKSGIRFRGQRLSDNNNAGRIGAGTGVGTVRVWIRRALNNPVILKEDKEATVPSLHGHKGRKFTAKPDGGGTYESTTYTAFNKPRGGEKFSTQYSSNFSDGMLDAATTQGTAARVASPSFDHTAGWKKFELPDNNIAVLIPGTYHGVAGTYSCVPGSGNTCAANVYTAGFGLGGVTAANVFSRNNAAWTFKPDDPEARVMTRPGTQAYEYGWWLHKSQDNNTWYAGSFFNVGDEYELPAATKGTATYQGGAAGVYALNSSTGGTIDSGRFTARATLQADFNDATITGTIDNFTGNDGQPRNWTVELKNLAIADDSDVIGRVTNETEGPLVDDTTVWTIDGSPADVSGNWHGRWTTAYTNADGRQVDPPSGVPGGVAGRFYTEYGNGGKMTGGFGASCTTCPEDN